MSLPSATSATAINTDETGNNKQILRRTTRRLRPLSMAAVENNNSELVNLTNAAPKTENDMHRQYPAVTREDNNNELVTPRHHQQLYQPYQQQTNPQNLLSPNITLRTNPVAKPRHNSLPGGGNNYNHRHSISLGGLNNCLDKYSSTFSHSNNNNKNTEDTTGMNSRPRSGVWDEIEAVRERIQRLRAGKSNTSSNGSLNSNESTPTTSPKPAASLEQYTQPIEQQQQQHQYAHSQISSNSQESTEDDEKINHLRDDNNKRFEDSFNHEDDSNNNNLRDNEDMDDDWEQQGPVSSIMMSSPVPSYNNKSFDNDISSHSASPTLTRQSPAEKHLLEVIEKARRERDHDILVVMLERVVTDTMSLYNHCDSSQADHIDKVCLSLSDFILQFLENSEEAVNTNYRRPFSPRPSSSIHTTTPSTAYNTPLRRFPQTRHTPSSNPPPSASISSNMYHDNTPPISATSYRPNNIRNEYFTQSSPITRSTTSPMISTNQRRRISKRFEPEKRGFF